MEKATDVNSISMGGLNNAADATATTAQNSIILFCQTFSTASAPSSDRLFDFIFICIPQAKYLVNNNTNGMNQLSAYEKM